MKTALQGARWNDVSVDLQDRLSRVAEGTDVSLYSSTTAGAPFEVEHDLKETPTSVSFYNTGNSVCWYTDADREKWNDRTVTVRCNVANQRITVRIESV